MFVLIYGDARDAFYFNNQQDLIDWLTEEAMEGANVEEDMTVHELSDKTKRRVLVKSIEVQVVK